MKILIRDLMQDSDAPDEIMSPSLADIYTAANNFTANFASPITIDCIGVGNTDATEIIIGGIEYEIRDVGPAGGLIFAKVDNGDGTYTYYEAAPTDQTFGKIWSNIDDVEIGSTAQGSAVGTGIDNTAAIIGQVGHTDSAAKLCNDLSIGGYTDWFLPSIDTLDAMYTQLRACGVGGFVNAFYWTSTETNAIQASGQNFENGTKSLFGTKSYNNVNTRACRSFTTLGTDTINITQDYPFSNGLYKLTASMTSDQFVITHNGTYIGRVAIGVYRKLGTSPTKEIGFYSTSENRVTLSGQSIPGAGGYFGRRVDVAVPYKIDEDIYDDIYNAYSQIGRGFPYFILFDDEVHKFPVSLTRFYADTDKPLSMLQSASYQFFYSYKFAFFERF